MKRVHQYHTTTSWTGNQGTGTSSYAAYLRNHLYEAPGKKPLEGSADPAFRGDATRWNPEELFLNAISSCHMLWFLHLCADAGITVIDYKDQASGLMQELETGGGHFSEVRLNPMVTILEPGKTDLANSLHEAAGKKCFIANSCNFPIHYEPQCLIVTL